MRVARICFQRTSTAGSGQQTVRRSNPPTAIQSDSATTHGHKPDTKKFHSQITLNLISTRHQNPASQFSITFIMMELHGWVESKLQYLSSLQKISNFHSIHSKQKLFWRKFWKNLLEMSLLSLSKSFDWSFLSILKKNWLKKWRILIFFLLFSLKFHKIIRFSSQHDVGKFITIFCFLDKLLRAILLFSPSACYHEKPFICEDSDELLNYVAATNPGLRL